MMGMCEVECKENDDNGMCNVNGWVSWNSFITMMHVKVTKF